MSSVCGRERERRASEDCTVYLVPPAYSYYTSLRSVSPGLCLSVPSSAIRSKEEEKVWKYRKQGLPNRLAYGLFFALPFSGTNATQARRCSYVVNCGGSCIILRRICTPCIRLPPPSTVRAVFLCATQCPKKQVKSHLPLSSPFLSSNECSSACDLALVLPN